MKIKINNHLLKKILAMFLIVLMIATTIPLNVFAATKNPLLKGITISNTRNLFFILLYKVMFLSFEIDFFS